MQLNKSTAHLMWDQLAIELAKSHLETYCLLLLAQTPSVNQLEKKHLQLPANQQLPRELLIKLVRVKRELLKNPEDPLFWTLPPTGLANHYTMMLRQGREQVCIDNVFWPCLISSAKELGIDRDYVISFDFAPDLEFKLICRCHIHPYQNNKALARIVIDKNCLTEELTYKITTLVPGYLVRYHNEQFLVTNANKVIADIFFILDLSTSYCTNLGLRSKKHTFDTIPIGEDSLSYISIPYHGDHKFLVVLYSCFKRLGVPYNAIKPE